MISNTTWLTVAAGAGVLVLFCVYYDRKRRNDPLYKEKVRERRKKALENRKKPTPAPEGSIVKPNPLDPESFQKFFLQEVQIGEELLGAGDIQNGIEHLANALAVCTQPHQLMSIFQQTLPPQVCQMLVTQIPLARQRVLDSVEPRDNLLSKTLTSDPVFNELE